MGVRIHAPLSSISQVLRQHLCTPLALARAAAFAAVTTLGIASANATDLRGRLDSRNPYNGWMYPRAGAQIILLYWDGRAWMPAQMTASGADGMYYFHDIIPGQYFLQVNGVSYPLSIYPQRFQDIQPVFVP